MTNTKETAATYQPSLFDAPQNRDFSQEKLDKLGQRLNSPYFHHDQKNPIVEEVKHNRFELRKRIGLNFTKNKYPDIDPKFIRYLRKHVYRLDAFGIFSDYDHLYSHEIPEGLNERIEQVTLLISDLLSPFQYNRYKLLNKYIKDYQENGYILLDQ